MHWSHYWSWGGKSLGRVLLYKWTYIKLCQKGSKGENRWWPEVPAKPKGRNKCSYRSFCCYVYKEWTLFLLHPVELPCASLTLVWKYFESESPSSSVGLIATDNSNWIQLKIHIITGHSSLTVFASNFPILLFVVDLIFNVWGFLMLRVTLRNINI